MLLVLRQLVYKQIMYPKKFVQKILRINKMYFCKCVYMKIKSTFEPHAMFFGFSFFAKKNNSLQTLYHGN